MDKYVKQGSDKTIRYYRKRVHLKQGELADILGITSTDMSFYENKHKYPCPELAERLAETLHVPIGKLYEDYELELILRRQQCSQRKNI